MPNAYKHLGRKLSKERMEMLSLYDDSLLDDEEEDNENK